MVTDLPRYAEYVDVWAIVIGISRYRDTSLNLQFAHRDAQAVSRWLLDHGGVKTDRLVELVDESATTANVTWALRSFLQRPAREDLVLVFLACHGCPDPNRPGNVYLLTHDTDPGDVAGTAMPMREIELALRENLLAERVVILADTCHSAAIGDNRRKGADAAQVNAFLLELGRSKPGTALLASAEASETALEGIEWGGGHGVFTHHLLDGLRGAARKQGAASIKLGELFDHVRDAVRRSTRERQHPSIGPYSFDRQMPIGVASALAADQLVSLGACLIEFGRRLDDRSLIESGLRRLRASQSKGESHRDDSLYPLAEAQAWLGQHTLAITTLRTAAERHSGQTEAQALLSLLEAACVASARAGGGSAPLGYARCRALVVAVDEYPRLEGWNLADLLFGAVGSPCGRDAEAMAATLRAVGFRAEDIVVLRDGEATRDKVLATLAHFAESPEATATVVFYYAGLGSFEATAGLVVADTRDANAPEQVISEQLLAQALGHVSATGRMVVIDAPICARASALVADGRAALIAAAQPGGPVTLMPDRSGGVLTRSLGVELRRPGLATGPLGFLHSQLARRMRSLAGQQEPVLQGDPRSPFVDRRGLAQAAWDFVLRPWHGVWGSMLLGELQALVLRQRLPNPGLASALVQAHLARADPPAAAALLRHWDASRTPMSAQGAIWMLATAAQGSDFALATRGVRRVMKLLSGPPLQVGAVAQMLMALGQFKAAHTLCQRLAATDRDAHPELVLTSVLAEQLAEKRRKLPSLQVLRTGLDRVTPSSPAYRLGQCLLNGRALQRRMAVVVGVGANSQAQLDSARWEAERMAEVLVSMHGFAAAEVQLLVDEDATRERIDQALLSVAERARPADSFLFFYSGHVMQVTTDSPTAERHDCYVAFGGFGDGLRPDRCLGSVALDAHLRRIAANEQLVVLDAAGPHMMALATRQRRYTLLASASPGQGAKDGLFSSVLVDELANSDDVPGSTGELVRRVAERMATNFLSIGSYKSAFPPSSDAPQKPHLIGRATMRPFGMSKLPSLRERLALTRERWPAICGAAVICFDLALREFTRTGLAVKLLRETVHIDAADARPEAWLHLGVALGLQGDYAAAIDALRTAVAQATGQTFAHAHLHLGRLLMESGTDLGQAVAELRRAANVDASNPVAQFLLAHALKLLVQQQGAVEAAEAYRRYAEAGSPHGFDERLHHFAVGKSV
jgi:uncharacterized caspase-like protein